MFKQMFTLSSVHVPFIGVAWQATLAVWAETDGATKQRLHGLARALAESGRGWLISWKLHETNWKQMDDDSGAPLWRNGNLHLGAILWMFCCWSRLTVLNILTVSGMSDVIQNDPRMWLARPCFAATYRCPAQFGKTISAIWKSTLTKPWNAKELLCLPCLLFVR